MASALVIAITPAERELTIRMLRRAYSDADIELAKPLIQLLENAQTAAQTRTAFAQLDPTAVTEPTPRGRGNAYLHTHKMGTGKDR